MKSLVQLNLLRLWPFFNKRRRIQIVLLLILMCSSAILEMVSLGAILPFLAVLIEPERALDKPIVAAVASLFGVSTADELILPLTIGFASAAMIAGAFRLALVWGTSRVGLVIGADISIEVYRRTLYQPFHVHITRNSSEVIANITQKVNQTSKAFHSLLTGLASLVSAVGVITALLLIDAKVATLAAIGLGFSYGVIAYFSRKQLEKNSNRIKRNSSRVVQTLMEGFGAIRDVLLHGIQDTYTYVYGRVDRPLRHAIANNNFISASPRMMMEAIGMALIAILAYFLSQTEAGITPVLPVLGVLALGAQKLLPAFQQVFMSYSNVAGYQGVTQDVVEMLEQPIDESLLKPPPEPYVFRENIEFQNVYFRYNPAQQWVLKEFSLRTPKGARIGFSGRTGEGKSTALDLLMGLLEPEKGRVTVDGKPLLGDFKRAWQMSISHVPQSIFLADASIAENIAFGVSYDAIDFERLESVISAAQLEEFVSSLPGEYNASVGERGIRLSGGQRQRIGIARALYKEASVLVFDEATSALDSTTEDAVMQAIGRLSSELTIFIIAHRLSTIENCDQIVFIDQGTVAAEGSYNELLRTNPQFRELAKQSDVSS